MNPIAIECSGLVKRYGPTAVVEDVSIGIRRGTVHSLVGANGAGKSTLLGMMSGRVAPSQGEVRIDGEHLPAGNPKAARRLGVTAVYQELTILPALSCAANVFLGQELTGGPFLARTRMNARFRELCEEFDLELDPEARAGDLSVAQAQMLEILRAVQAESDVILFDEPTAALSERERRRFLDLVRLLRERGKTMVLVTHNLGEVLEVSDEITVMRAGRVVGSAPVSEWDQPSLVAGMTGEETATAHVYDRGEPGEVVLEARGVTLPGAIEGVDISVRAGEVVGLAGLVGAGRTSLLRSLAGAEPSSSGTLTMHGEPVRWPRRVRAAMRRGIGLIPEERKTQGLLLRMSVPDNATLTDTSPFGRLGVISRRRQLDRARDLLDGLSLSRPVGPYPVGDLSGGNQQKVAVAKWLHEDPDVLLVDEPTRGIDVAAKTDVLHALRDLANRGKAVIMTSSEIDEVLEVSDRVVVMAEGRAVAEFDLRVEHPTVKDVLDIAFGLKEKAQ